MQVQNAHVVLARGSDSTNVFKAVPGETKINNLTMLNVFTVIWGIHQCIWRTRLTLGLLTLTCGQ